jgi:hypothetical protein
MAVGFSLQSQRIGIARLGIERFPGCLNDGIII